MQTCFLINLPFPCHFDKLPCCLSFCALNLRQTVLCSSSGLKMLYHPLIGGFVYRWRFLQSNGSDIILSSHHRMVLDLTEHLELNNCINTAFSVAKKDHFLLVSVPQFHASQWNDKMYETKLQVVFLQTISFIPNRSSYKTRKESKCSSKKNGCKKNNQKCSFFGKALHEKHWICTPLYVLDKQEPFLHQKRKA